MANLVAVGAPESTRWQLSAINTIGRDPANSICLPDPLVSPRHAEVRLTAEGRYRLVDVGSRRGTFRASERVTSVLLEHGEEILIGPARLRFEASNAEAGADKSAPEPRVRSFPVPEPSFKPAMEIGTLEELRRDYEKLRAAVELSRAIGTEQDLPTLARRILGAAFKLLGADRGAIALLESATGSRPLHIACKQDGTDLPFALSTSLAGEVISTRAAMISHDVATDPRLQRAESLYGDGVRSTMCVPLLHAGEMLGVIQVDSLSAINVFTEKDLGLFFAVASQAALAVKKALLDGRAQSSRFEDRLRLERLVRMLPSGVVLLDAQRRVTAVNERARRLLEPFCFAEPGEALHRIGQVGLDELVGQGASGPRTLVADDDEKTSIAITARRSHEQGETVLVIESA